MSKQSTTPDASIITSAPPKRRRRAAGQPSKPTTPLPRDPAPSLSCAASLTRDRLVTKPSEQQEEENKNGMSNPDEIPDYDVDRDNPTLPPITHKALTVFAVPPIPTSTGNHPPIDPFAYMRGSTKIYYELHNHRNENLLISESIHVPGTLGCFARVGFDVKNLCGRYFAPAQRAGNQILTPNAYPADFPDRHPTYAMELDIPKTNPKCTVYVSAHLVDSCSTRFINKRELKLKRIAALLSATTFRLSSG